MNICFGFKLRPFFLCYKFDLIGPCWSKVSISSSRFVCSFGREHCVWVLEPKSVWKFHGGEDDSLGERNQLVSLTTQYGYSIS